MITSAASRAVHTLTRRGVRSRGLGRISAGQARAMCTADDDPRLAERERMDFDVVIVGGGPAGLSAAIRLKQLEQERGTGLSVAVVDKGAEVGAHVLSGNVFEPRALNELFPDWKDRGAPVHTEAKEDKFLLLSEKGSLPVPQALLPPALHNEGNYVISLSQLSRWLAEQAEDLGVEVLPAISASEVLYREDGGVTGIATSDMGLNKDGTPKDVFMRGMELRARQTLFAEGCRGSCSEALMRQFNLREGRDEQTYGLGLKEVWEVPSENHRPGFIQHTLGWPLQQGLMDKTFGGSFLYHMEPNLVLVGMVVGLDYENPYLSPYSEFQRWKHHPEVSKHLEGGECISYGARCLNEGGYHAIPKLTFPGGALIGCSAGFLNAVKIKGSHTAMKSGMVAAESVYEALVEETGENTVEAATELDEAVMGALDVSSYEQRMEQSWVYDELREVRNAHASFHYGVLPGLVHSGLAGLITKGKEPWSIRNKTRDADRTKPAAESKKIEYPKPDGVLSFDLLTNLARTGTYHEDQPSHLKIKPEFEGVPEDLSYPVYAGPEQRFCPAKVYEYTDGSEHPEGKPQLVINAQNCIHCKCCSIKMPKEYIDWQVPEGGGGPAYTNM